MSEALTRGIRVRVEAAYVPSRSAPRQALYLFAYQVTIHNEGRMPVQLLERRWTITDATGHSEQVQGPGVVGEQPRLEPGGSFEYTSFCPLKTQMGSMQGIYRMVTADGERFDAHVAPFTLALPHALN